jgi:hypothetical protein
MRVGITPIRRPHIHCLVALVGVGEPEQGGVPLSKPPASFGTSKLSRVLMNWKPEKAHHEKIAQNKFLAMIAIPHHARGRYPYAVYTRIKFRTPLDGILACASKLAPLQDFKSSRTFCQWRR